MLELVFALLAIAPRGPGVDIAFVEGPQVTHYRLPMPVDNQSTRMRASEETAPTRRLDVAMKAHLFKDKSGATWLDYEIRRTSVAQAPSAPKLLSDVDLEGAVALPQSGPVTVGEVGGVRVQLEVTR